jgi:hypothetical protein
MPTALNLAYQDHFDGALVVVPLLESGFVRVSHSDSTVLVLLDPFFLKAESVFHSS